MIFGFEKKIFSRKKETPDDDRNDYIPGSIEMGRADPASFDNEGNFVGRGLEAYCHWLGIREEDLTDKSIIDLGAGRTARLARETKEKYPGATVFSVSPDYANTEYTKDLPQDQLLVAATGQQLPFENNSVDYVLSMWVTPHLPDGLTGASHEIDGPWRLGDIGKIASEAYRVLKPGGTFAIFPLIIHTEHATELNKASTEVIRAEDEHVSTFRHLLPDVEEIVIETVATATVGEPGEIDALARVRFIK